MGALTLFILPLQVCLAPAGVTVPERSVLAAREGPGSSTGEAWSGHVEDSQTWSKGKNTPGESLSVKDELKPLLPVRNFTLHNP